MSNTNPLQNIGDAIAQAYETGTLHAYHIKELVDDLETLLVGADLHIPHDAPLGPDDEPRIFLVTYSHPNALE